MSDALLLFLLAVVVVAVEWAYRKQAKKWSEKDEHEQVDDI